MIRFEKILCPVDFFPASLKAFDYALKLAANYDARVHVLHVVPPIIPAAYGGYSGIGAQDMTLEFARESKAQLKKLNAAADKMGIPIETEVRLGDIDVEIRRTIQTKKADLVVMGTHGRRGFERWFMGSVTERLMRHCPVPLLTMGAARKSRAVPPSVRSILVTTDFSAGTSDALAYAFSVAQECEAKVTLLHVVDDETVNLGTKVRDPFIEIIRERLDSLVPPKVQGWCDVETRVETGIPYQEILKMLKARRIGLLVMNVHGKSMLDRALVGSTAERVVRATECPVMLVPPMKARRSRRTGKRA